MLSSMTGYGKSETITDECKLIVEMRSVNHRHGEVTVKLPRQFMSLESEIKKRVTDRFKRGKIDVFINYDHSASGGVPPQVNLLLAKSYYDSFVALNHHLGIYEPIQSSLILAQRDVLAVQEVTPDLEKTADVLYATLDEAMNSFEKMRTAEGIALFEEIKGRITLISGIVDSVAARAPLAVANNVERMKERLARLLGDIQLDEMRLAQEVAIIADRMEITEELVRLRSHFVQFDALLNADEPVGRKIDFLLQEMNREVNTIGSKANDSVIASYVVELKSEMEKVREQIQNVE